MTMPSSWVPLPGRGPATVRQTECPSRKTTVGRLRATVAGSTRAESPDRFVGVPVPMLAPIGGEVVVAHDGEPIMTPAGR